MPEYLAPGVYVEETSFRAKSIEGVSTSTAGFVGPARYGPADGLPELVTSFAEFERVFGGLDRLEYDGETERAHNYLAHGVRAFFDNGGKRLYVSRIFALPEAPEGGALTSDQQAIVDSGGRASATVGGGLTVRARFPGRAGAARVSFTLRVGGNVLATDRDPVSGVSFNVLRGVNPDDVVYVADQGSPVGSPPGGGTLFRAERYFDDTLGRSNWRLHPGDGSTAWDLRSLVAEGAGRDSVHPVSVSVEVTFVDRVGNVLRRDTFENLGLHPEGRRSVGTTFAADLPNRSQALRTPVIFQFASGTNEGGEVARLLLDQLEPTVGTDVVAANGKSFEIALTGGSDGVRPTAEDYEGDDSDVRRKTGLRAFEDVPDISIVAAPGYSAGGNADDTARAATQAVSNALVSHAERMRYRIAVLDSADDQALSDVRAQRAQLDSSYAALYYPWVRILDPVTDQEIILPPSGFVSGIYARNDVEKGVHKAPANEVVRGALGFELTLNKGQQDVLNPEGINCFRWFEGRGNRLWGARTISSDPEWKYVNLRRYFAYLERSIERGTQWVVFENNSEPLWANVRRTVEDFLYNEWKQGHLMGDKPETSYFVKCDRTTMTQNDFDNGRLICLIGVAPVRPAEFVIFRIGQWTGDRKV
ncbi:MAG TPA: phage tail sheath subtilisin-like domain-containing protein [Longimicrobium sp.]|nr:phage tail sheath subtilisin-like domain-containing protein [Longimicrobium sp.]